MATKLDVSIFFSTFHHSNRAVQSITATQLFSMVLSQQQSKSETRAAAYLTTMISDVYNNYIIHDERAHLTRNVT